MRRLLVIAASVLTVICVGTSSSQAETPGAGSTSGQDKLQWRAAHATNAILGLAKALQTWGACGTFDSNTRVVRTFTRAATFGVSPYMGSGTSNLGCGSDTGWGYRHIVHDHLSHWQARAAEANENWRDTADYGIMWALQDPDRVTYRASNDTYCFSRLINLVNRSNGQVVDHYYPNVVIAHVTRNIITAFPSSSQCT